MTLLLLIGCSDRGFTQLTQEDFFQQNRINTVDLMVVVDNSCSMAEEQDKLATNFSSFIQYFEQAEVDWQIGVVTTDIQDENFAGRLVGGDDEIILAGADGYTVDQVSYDRDWAIAAGQVYTLDPTYFAGIRNDSADDWCVSTEGSPGELNTSCAEEEGLGQDDRYGAVIITEFLVDPDGVDDAYGEWIELTNISAADIDLTGWSLYDNGRNAWTFPDGAMIAAGGTYVVARSADEGLNGGVLADAETGDSFTLLNDVRVLTQDTEDPAATFSEIVAQGTSGAGIEMGLEAARLALEPEALAGNNAGFLREDANLSVLIVSDEEDSSPLSVNDYLSYFADLKGDIAYRDHSVMNVSAVVGDQPPAFEGEPSCASTSGYADYGSRYVFAANQTGGLIDSICDEDFAPIVNDLGLTLSGLEAEFILSRVPDLDSLEVAIYNSPDEDSKDRDLTLDVDYTYVEERNSIRFENDQVPESEQYIKASYKIQSGT